MTPELSVLIVNYNTWRECAGAVQSLRQHPPTRPDGSVMPYEVIVVDNCSPRREPGAIEQLRQALAAVGQDFGDSTAGQLILHGDNGGYSKGVNLAFRSSRGRWILVSNPDLEFPNGCISALQRQLERDRRAGCVVPKGYWDHEFLGRLPPNTLPTLRDLLITTLGSFCRPLQRWYARRLARRWLAVWEDPRPRPLPMMSGCLFLIERSLFESLGLMDERYPLYYEDADLSVTIARAGRRVVQVPDSRLVHFVNRSGQTEQGIVLQRHDVSRALFYRKWSGRLGAWLLDACNRLLRSPRWQRWQRPPSDRGVVDLGASEAPPLLRLPHRCERFLLLVSLDRRFYLSGGLIGSGDSWTPSAGVFANFSPTTYWLRAYDLTAGRFAELGTWRYTCIRRAAVPVAAVAGG